MKGAIVLTVMLTAASATATEVPVAPRRSMPRSDGGFTVGAVASGPRSHLVVADHILHSAHVDGRLAARTFALDGTPLQPTDFDLGNAEVIAAAWTGREYEVVVTSLETVPGPGPRRQRRIAIAEDGSTRLLEPQPWRAIASAIAGDRTLIAETDGERFALRLAGATGDTIRRDDVPFAVGAVASTASGFVVAAFRGSDVILVPVSADGAIGVARVVGTRSGTSPRMTLAVNGATIAVAWETNWMIDAAIAAPDAPLVTRAGLAVAGASLGGIVISDEGAFEVIWWHAKRACRTALADARETCVTGVSDIHVVPARPTFIAARYDLAPRVARTLEELPSGRHVREMLAVQSAPAVVKTNNGLLVAWTEYDPDIGLPQLHLASFAANGTPIGRRLLAPAATTQVNARFARAGDRILLVWVETQNAGEVRGMLLDRAGNAIGPAFWIGRGVGAAVATDGREFLVVWEANGNTTPPHRLMASVVTANGGLLAPAVVAEDSGHEARPSVSWDGNGYVVAYRESTGEGAALHRRIVVERLNRIPAPAGLRTVLAERRDAEVTLAAPRIACGATCLAAWSRIDRDSGREFVDAAPIDTGTARTVAADPIVSPLVARADGAFAFLTASGPRLVEVSAAATLVRSSQFSLSAATAGDLAFDGSELVAVYARAGRVWLRLGQPSRRRATM